MGKLFRTKKQIVKILSTKNKTLTDMSRELNLAPSTVSQHLRELMAAGKIEQVDNPFLRKWKYYKVAAPNQQLNSYNGGMVIPAY